MQACPKCDAAQPEINRFCTQCGQRLSSIGIEEHRSTAPQHRPDQLHLPALYGMVAFLFLAILFPPWETPPSQSPAFLGLHFVLKPPTDDAIVSRMLLSIELTTITIGGLYAAFFFRKR